MSKKPIGAAGGQQMYFSGAFNATPIEGTEGNDAMTNETPDGQPINAYAYLRGNGGDDYITSNHWTTVKEGGSGNDLITSGDAGDYMSGGEGDDVLIADDLGDRSHMIDELYGESGNDTLINKRGYAYMEGGSGADRFIIETDKALGTTIKDFHGKEGDVVRLKGIDPDVARALVAGKFDDVCQRYNIRFENVKAKDVQMQLVTGDNGTATLEIRGKA